MRTLILTLLLGLPALALAADSDGDGWDERQDCDDDDPDVNPDAEEVVGNDKDDDCDGLFSCWVDDDFDGWGTDQVSEWEYGEGFACEDKRGAPVNGDCDDGDDEVNPGMEEIWYDGVDQDCDGNDDDQDGDGVSVDADCDDTDASVQVCEQKVGGGRGCATSPGAAWTLGLLLLMIRRRR